MISYIIVSVAFDISICKVRLSYHTELSQHHISTKGTIQALIVLVGADWVVEIGLSLQLLECIMELVWFEIIKYSNIWMS